MTNLTDNYLNTDLYQYAIRLNKNQTQILYGKILVPGPEVSLDSICDHCDCRHSSCKTCDCRGDCTCTCNCSCS